MYSLKNVNLAGVIEFPFAFILSLFKVLIYKMVPSPLRETGNNKNTSDNQESGILSTQKEHWPLWHFAMTNTFYSPCF